MYVDRRKAEMGERNQAASHSVNVVGQLKSELISTAKVGATTTTMKAGLLGSYVYLYVKLKRLKNNVLARSGLRFDCLGFSLLVMLTYA